MPKLICLMPTYNKEETLANAIESVIMQKTDFDYKLIILDDCSTDNSNRIANEYREKYPDKIEIVRNETNLKLLHSIINGYKLLKGADYFCVLDADDWYTYDKKFADAVKFLDGHPNYTMYTTNIILKKGEEETPYYQGDKKAFDFGLRERKTDNAIFIQTSGVVYRNIYFKEGKNEKFDEILSYKFPQSFRADGFRFEWYLHGGKAHFVNHLESVYNYDLNGIWSEMAECEQSLYNAKLMYSCAEFFPEDKEFYYSQCKQMFKNAMVKMQHADRESFAKNKELITFLYDYLYVSNDISIIKALKFIAKFIPCKYLRKLIKKSL